MSLGPMSQGGAPPLHYPRLHGAAGCQGWETLAPAERPVGTGKAGWGQVTKRQQSCDVTVLKAVGSRSRSLRNGKI